MLINENVQARLYSGNFVAGVFMGLVKAFDTIDHNI